MRKRNLAAVFVALSLMAGAAMADDAATAEVKKPAAPRVKSISEAMALAAQKNKPVLVDFYADW